MHIPLLAALVLAALAAFFSATSVMAQGPAPAEIGNRANGFDYQPTPSEVVPRERAAGVQPPAAERERENWDLERMDKQLLKSEGLSTDSVPKLTNGQ